MTSKNRHEASHTPNIRLGTVILLAATAAAVFEALHILTHAEQGESFHGRILGALIGALFNVGILSALGAVLARAIRFRLSPERLLAAMDAPFRIATEIIRGADETTLGTVRHLSARAFSLILFGGISGGVAYGILRQYHEPVRISVFIGVVVAIIVLPILSGTAALTRIAGDRLTFPFRVRQHLARILLFALPLVGVVATVMALRRRHDLFGVVDPYPMAMLLLFITLLFVATPISARWSPHRPKRPPVYAVSIFGFALAIFLCAVSVEGRGVADDTGTLSHLAYRAIADVLDMDNDGVAWLVGSDCHPLDPKANPFAREVPGNGYDEDCDGTDTSPVIAKYVDPLTRLAPFPKDKRVNRASVLMIISDATAARHLKMYGYERNTMPNLERFATHSTVFENNFATANHTSVAMPAMLSGRYPSTFPLVRSLGWNSFGIPEWSNPIQMRMKQGRHNTYLLAGHKLSGFARFFESVERGRGERLTAEELGKRTINRLRAIGPSPPNPVFVLAHFIDPHHPYRAATRPWKYGKKSKDRYDREINYVDEALGPILKLMTSAPYRDWLVLVTADHGEGFHEHRYPHHGHTLYDEEVRVPLVIRVPNTAPTRVNMAVSGIDIVPTFIDWCGLSADTTLPGHSLLPLVSRAATPKAVESRVVFSEFFRTGDVYGAYDGRFSMIYNRKHDRYEMYDQRTDPGQHNNIYSPKPRHRLEPLLKAHIRGSLRRLARASQKR